LHSSSRQTVADGRVRQLVVRLQIVQHLSAVRRTTVAQQSQRVVSEAAGCRHASQNMFNTHRRLKNQHVTCQKRRKNLLKICNKRYCLRTSHAGELGVVIIGVFPCVRICLCVFLRKTETNYQSQIDVTCYEYVLT